MAALYILTGNKDIDDLRFMIEANLDEVRQLSNRADKVRSELFATQDHIRLMREAITHLRSNECKIVSFAEYARLLIDIGKATGIEWITQHHLSMEQFTIDRLIESVRELERKIYSLQHDFGKVLEFKKRE